MMKELLNILKTNHKIKNRVLVQDEEIFSIDPELINEIELTTI